MILHRTVRISLYDYLHGDLDPDQRIRVEEHLSTCSKCAAELARMKELTTKLTDTLPAAGTLHEEEYWHSFKSEVLRHLGQTVHHRKATPALRPVRAQRLIQPRLAIGLAAMVVLATVLILRWQPSDGQHPMLMTGDSGAPTMVTGPEPQDQRVGQYIRRSRALLVGLSNMDPVEGESIDLSIEHDLSMELVKESRTLRDQEIGPGRSQMMRDLDRILVKVSQAGPESKAPEIVTIRNDIQRANLLFKLRMTESLYGSDRVETAAEKF
jgi:hypothetical protein